MVKVFINNLPVNVPLNTSVLEACEKIGILIPRFCYHENLNVAGNCRMCLIEIENAPKPIAACAYPVMNQMKIFTNSLLVKKARENVLEFLLINHPLDCPICDQGGECDLQEQTLVFGTEKSRYFFKKNSLEDINCSPLIKLIMTRCIQCTRCVRFFEKIVGNSKIGIIGRGGHGEISLFYKTQLNSEISGNIIDLCPVGALTSKNYAFMFRAWETQSNETIDHTDALGTKIKINYKGQELFRVLPLKTNLNDQWITDKTRFFLDGLKWNRLFDSYQFFNNSLFSIKWNRLLFILFNFLFFLKNKNQLNKILIVSSNLSLEAFELVRYFSYFYNINIIRENCVPVSSNTLYNLKNDISLDKLQIIDLLLIIGLNPRIESNLYNLKIKQNFFEKSQFIIGTFGVQDNLMYSILSLGNSYKFFIYLLEGKHFFCKQIVFATKPFFLVGSNLLNRLDVSLIKNSFFFLDLFSKKNNLNFGLMQSNFNEIGFYSEINLSKIDLQKVNFSFFLEPNLNIKTFFLKCQNLKNTILYSFIQPKVKFSKIQFYIPTKSYLENNETFLNFFGVMTKTIKILSLSNAARAISSIFQIFLFFIKAPVQSSLNYSSYCQNDFSKLLNKNESLLKKIKIQINKTILQKKIDNFYQTDLITKNSLILAKSAVEYRSIYNTF